MSYAVWPATRSAKTQIPTSLVAADYIAGGDYLGAVSHRDRPARLDEQAADCTRDFYLAAAFLIRFGIQRADRTHLSARSLVFHAGPRIPRWAALRRNRSQGPIQLRVERLETGEVVRKAEVPAEYFGEGITVFGQRIFQLTWQTQVGFIYAKSTFRPLGRFRYTGEGWGLTNDGKQVYMSDGSAQIRCLDPASLRELRRITVHDGKREIPMLNELECVDGEIYANVWQTDRIARIGPPTERSRAGSTRPVYLRQTTSANR